MATPDPNIRVSDAERDGVIDILRQHTADGRLRMDEFGERVTEALAATTRADLGSVLRDLPPLAVSPPAPRAQPRAAAWRPRLSGRVVAVAAAVVLVSVLVAQGAWWIAFFLFPVLGGCGGSRACGSRWVETTPADETAVEDRETIRV